MQVIISKLLSEVSFDNVVNNAGERSETKNCGCLIGGGGHDTEKNVLRYIAILFRCIAIYCDTLFWLYFYRNAIDFSIFAFTLNLTYGNQNYTHAHMSVWRPLIRIQMSQACFFWTYYCYRIGDEWKKNSSNRKEKSRDILRYTFRIAIRYKFLVYCDISICRYIVTPLMFNRQILENNEIRTLFCGF